MSVDLPSEDNPMGKNRSSFIALVKWLYEKEPTKYALERIIPSMGGDGDGAKVNAIENFANVISQRVIISEADKSVSQGKPGNSFVETNSAAKPEKEAGG